MFVRQVDIRIQDEDLRVRKFFHPVSYNRVIRECEARMVEDHIPYLQVECRQMIKEENGTGNLTETFLGEECVVLFPNACYFFLTYMYERSKRDVTITLLDFGT